MLSDEERKAIEVLQYVKNKTPFIFWYEDKPYNRKETINTILNLIKKQSKEIEELKEDKYGLEEEVQMQAKNIMLCESALCEIQDKIKAKIEELENYYRELYKQDNSPNEFLIGQDCLSKLSILQEVKQSLLKKE